MALAFGEQIALMNGLVEAPRLTVCIGSGVSLRRLPLLNELIALAFRAIPLTDHARNVFLNLTQLYGFRALLAAEGIVTNDPCSLDGFRMQRVEIQNQICKVL